MLVGLSKGRNSFDKNTDWRNATGPKSQVIVLILGPDQSRLSEESDWS